MMTTTQARTVGLITLLGAAALLGACNPDRNGGGGPSPSAGSGDAGAVAVGGAGPSGSPGASGDVAAATGGDLQVSGSMSTMGFGYESGDEIAKTRVDRFKSRYPEVKLKVAEGSFDEQAFLSSVASGDPPDAVYLDRNLIGTYAARHAIQSLDDCIAKAPIDMSTFREAAAAQVTIDGSVYAIPEFYNTRVLMIDADVAKDAGVDPQTISTKDWDALVALEGQLSKGKGDGLKRLGFDPKLPGALPLWVKANGGAMLSDDGRESLLDDPKVAEALAFAKKLYDAVGGKKATDAFSQTWDFFGAKNEFAKDQLGAMPMEQWYINVLAENSPDANVVVKPLEARDGSPITFADGNAWAIPQGAKNPDAACAFMATMTATDTWIAAAQARAKARAADNKAYTGTYTANKAADDAIFGQIYQPSGNAPFDDAVKVVLDNQDHAFSLPASPAAAEFDKAWQDAVDRVLTDGDDPVAALKQADDEAQSAIDQASAP